MRHDRAATSHPAGWSRRVDAILVSPTALRVLLVAATVYIFIKMPAVLVLGLWITVIWIVPRSILERRMLQRQEPAPDPVMDLAIEYLRLQVSEADMKVSEANRKASEAHQKLSEAHKKVAEINQKLSEANKTVAEAHTRIARLEGDLAQAKQQAKQEAQSRASEQAQTQGHPTFRRVGLDQGCPQWAAETLRREYRKRLHPDTKPPRQRAEATRRFQEMEKAFDEIWKIRRF